MDISIWWWIFGGLAFWFVLSIYAGVSEEQRKALQKNAQREKDQGIRKNADARIAEVIDFDVEHAIRNPSHFYLLTNRSMTEFLYATFNVEGDIEQKCRFSHRDIVSFGVVDGAITTTTINDGELKPKHGLARAAVGGAAFGGAGAVVGAVTAKKTVSSTSRSTESRGPATIRLGLRSAETPILTLRMMPAVADEWGCILQRAYELE